MGIPAWQGTRRQNSRLNGKDQRLNAKFRCRFVVESKEVEISFGFSKQTFLLEIPPPPLCSARQDAHKWLEWPF